MSAEIPYGEPAELIAGDTWSWKRALDDYPASAYTLAYYFRSQAGEFTVTATASGTDHLATVAKATTAGYKAGLYEWTAVVSDSTTRTTVGKGLVQVLPDPANTGAGFDPRSHARRVLEAIEAVLENRATKDQEEYTIGNRSLKRTPVAELKKLRDQYRAEVAAERQAENAAQGRAGSLVVFRL